MAEAPKLRQKLHGFQIFFIVISAVIGGGVFSNNGEALELSGPGGLILSVVMIGIISISVSECVGEFSQQFPAPNAIVEYVKVFVDEDLSWVVGIAYWYAFVSVFAVENLAAAGLSRYWGLSQTFQTLAFYVASPLIILGLNLTGVFWYGLVETVGGALKCCLILGVSILLYTIAGKGGDGGSNGPINDGIQNDPTFATDAGRAVCYAIPLVAFSFYGVESLAVSAYEAKYSTSLAWPSRYIAYVIFLFYFLCTIGGALTVPWTAPYLPPIFGVAGSSSAGLDSPPRSANWVVNVTLAAGYNDFAGFLNGCFIFSVLSTSNTALYIASRTLYGLTREIPDSNILGRILNRLSLVVRQTGVPAAALLFTSVFFFWLPFLQLKSGYAIEELIEIISVSGSISCLIVWCALCLAFIRYERWLKICDTALSNYPHYQRHSSAYKPYTFFAWFQPWVAWIGLVGCILVFMFSSATWWSTPASFTKVAVAYAAHIILFVLFVIFKMISRQWWVKLNPDVQVLVRELDRLRWLKQDEGPVRPASTSQNIEGEPIDNPPTPPIR